MEEKLWLPVGVEFKRSAEGKNVFVSTARRWSRGLAVIWSYHILPLRIAVVAYVFACMVIVVNVTEKKFL